MNMHLFKSPSSAISVSIVVLWVPVIEKSLVEENWGGVHEPYQVRNNHLRHAKMHIFGLYFDYIFAAKSVKRRESKAFKSNSDIRLKRSAANLEDLPTCKMSKLPRYEPRV